MEVIKGIVDNIKPKLIIVIDSLASKSIERISSTVQLSDTGIVPGAGVGNARNEISQVTLGIPVIAIGVPMVVEAATIAADSIDVFIEKLQNEGESNDYLNKLKDEDKYGRLFDVERERKYNSHFKSYMNYYDLRKKILEINNDLTICYSLKLELVDFYSKSTIDNAKVNLENLIRSCIDTNIDEMIAFSNNLINWKQEIINSFTIVGTEYKVEADKGQVVVCNKKVNNAIIENRNKIIKCIKNNANGYTNWSRFRNRVMYVLDPNATFSLEPREK